MDLDFQLYEKPEFIYTKYEALTSDNFVIGVE